MAGGKIDILVHPDTSKFPADLKRGLSGAEGAADQSGKSLGSKVSSGIGTALKASVAGVGVAAGGALAGAITKGMGRLTGIENAQASLKGLGHEAESVEAIMDNALGAVRGTAFGLEEAAGVAASTVAAGVAPGAELERTLSMVGDAATIAGVEMGAMGSIVNKVATSDMMQMDVANQLMDAGIPILQMVADEMGTTADEARKMASEGKISFETFQNALEEGVGGAALAAGDTFQGAMANLGAALGRLGATGLTPFFDLAKDALGGATGAIDDLEARLGPVMDNVSSWLTSTGVPAVRGFIDQMQEMGGAVASGISAALPTVQRVIGVLGDGFTQIGGSVRVVGGGIVDFASAVAGALAPAAEGAVGLAEGLGSMTGPLMLASAALAVGKWQDWGSAISGATSSLKLNSDQIRQQVGIKKSLAELDGKSISTLSALTAVMETHSPVVARAAGAWRDFGGDSLEFSGQMVTMGREVGGLEGTIMSATGQVSRFGGAIGGGLAGAASVGKSALDGIVGALGGPWNIAIAGAVMAFSGITAEIDKTERSAELLRDLGNAADDMGDQLFGALAKGDVEAEFQALSDGVETLLTSYEQLAETAPGFWADVWGSVKDLGKAFSDEPASEVLLAEQEAIAENAKLVTEALEGAGITAQDAAAAVGGSSDQYNELIWSLDDTTEAGRAAISMLAEQRAEYRRMQEIVDDLAPGSVELSEAMAVIGDEAASSEERVSALSDALDLMLGIDPSADEALSDLHEGIDEVTAAAEEALDQTEGWGDSLFGEDGALNFEMANSRELRETLLGMRDDLEQVAIAGEDVGAAFDSQQGALQALAEQYGIPIERVQELAAEMGLVPTLIESAVELETNDALTGLSEVYAAIEQGQIKAGEPVSLAVTNVDESKAAIEDLGWSVEVLHEDAEGRGAVEIVADTDQAISDVQTFVDAIAAIDPEKGITFHSNSTEQADLVRSLGFEVEDLGDGQFQITSNTAAEIEKMVDLGLLVVDEKTGEVTINSNLDEVLGKAAELDKRHDKTTRETHEVVKTERLQRVIENYNTHNVNPDGSIKGYMASGGRVPKYAAGSRHGGYRLPTTGPGTEETDGFWAEDLNGAMVARLDAGEWVINGASSETYDRELAEINAGVFPKLPGYADGARHGGASASSAKSEGAAVATVELDAPGVAGELAGINEEIEAIDSETTVTVHAEAQQAAADVTRVGDEVEGLPSSTMVGVDASTEAATSGITTVDTGLADLAATETIPEVGLDTTAVESGSAEASSSLDTLGAMAPVPTADLDSSSLHASADESGARLDDLGAMNPIPTAGLDPSELDAGVQHSQAELERVGSMKATPVVDTDNTGAVSGINTVIDGLNSMPVKRRIEVVASGSAAGAMTMGSQIPRLATGGRLPTTGPGTSTVDGILGVDGDGVPTARVDAGEWVINRRASEKYDRELAAINAGTFPLQALADGGRVSAVSPEQLLDFASGAMVLGQQAARSLQGAAYIWGGVNWGDCSGAMSGLARFAVGMEAFAGRFATGNQAEALASLGFLPGLGDAATSFNLGWFNGGPWGGHTAGTIAGTNVEMGGGAGGQGKIGGAAAGASHPQFTNHAHLPLGELWAFDEMASMPGLANAKTAAPAPGVTSDGGQGVGDGGLGVASTNVNGLVLTDGRTIPWGQAGGGVFDTGGVLNDRSFAVNFSGEKEAVLNASQWAIFDGAVRELPPAATALNDAAGAISTYAKRLPEDPEGSLEAIRAEVAKTGTYLQSTTNDAGMEVGRAMFGLDTAGDQLAELVGTGMAQRILTAVDMTDFGGGLASNSREVAEAEAERAEVIAQVASELDDVTEAEKALVEAQRELTEAREGDTEASLSIQRRIEDAQRSYNEALADGKQEKIADAERKLARAREDAAADTEKNAVKQAEAVEKAAERVEKAEKSLTDARKVTEDQTYRLEQAEIEVVAARFRAIQNLATTSAAAMQGAFGALSGLFSEIAAQAAIMAQTRQQLASERIAQQNANYALRNARIESMRAEQNLAKVRADGAISVADAEANLGATRETTTLKGATGIDAMARAMDRAKTTGIFAVEEVTVAHSNGASQQINSVHQVQAAQDAADDAELDAIHQQELAMLDVKAATLAQAEAAAMVEVSTKQLADQAARLNGLTEEGATRAAAGWEGASQAAGGLGKIFSGVMKGLTGMAAMGGNPLGLLAGALDFIPGIFELLTGGRSLLANIEEVIQSFDGMSFIDKLITGLGMLLGVGTAAGGASLGEQYGSEFAEQAIEAGSILAQESANYVTSGITTDLERINSLAEEERQWIQDYFRDRNAELDREYAALADAYLMSDSAQQADADRNSYLASIDEATTLDQANALQNAADVAANRRDEMLDMMARQLDVAEKAAELKPNVTYNLPAGKTAMTMPEVEALLNKQARDFQAVLDSQVNKQGTSGREYQYTRSQ